MGTNYYATDTDGHVYHLGKRSAGWAFTFRAFYFLTEDGVGTVRTIRDLVGFFETNPVTITDEYGTDTNPVEFMQMARGWNPDGHQALSDGSCRCGHDPDVHGPLDDLTVAIFAATESVDEATGTVWVEREFC